ncbi:MAG: chromate transporter [Lentisphaeria bacterium]|nr:chromate transporter [Lentisphaeria bacterium]
MIETLTGSLYLFYIFAKISLFTFGGGYAMIPLFQSELVENSSLLTADEFADLVALAQMTPGPVGMNAATYIGYQQFGLTGAIFATFGTMAPSLVLMTLAVTFLTAFKESRFVKALLGGIRPVTIGLIAAGVIFFANISIFTAPIRNLWTGAADQFGLCWQGCVIFALILFLQLKWKLNLFLVLLIAIVLGMILCRF